MTAAKPKTLVALTSFVCTVDGVELFFREGETVAADHPAVKGREELFEPFEPSKPTAA